MIPGIVQSQMLMVDDDLTFDEIIAANSPRVYYKLDETSGTTAADSSGNGYDITTFVGAPTLGAADIGNSTGSFSLDGADDALVGPYIGSLSFPFTLIASINLNGAPGGTRAVLTSHERDDIYTGSQVLINAAGAVAVRFGDGAGAGSSSRKDFVSESDAYTAGNDILIIAVCDDIDTVSLYVNGLALPIASTTGTASSLETGTATDFLSIARAVLYSPDRYLATRAARVAILESAVSASDVTALFEKSGITGEDAPVSASDVLYFYELNESSGDFIDSTGSLDLDTITGTINRAQTTIRSGGVGSLYIADPDDPKVGSSSAPSLLYSASSLSVSFWAKLDDVTASDRRTVYTDAIDLDDADRNIWIDVTFSADGNSLRWITESGSGTDQNIEFTGLDIKGENHHFLLSYDFPSGLCSLYVDGALFGYETSLTAPTGGTSSAKRASVGSSTFFGRQLFGRLQQVVITGTAATAREAFWLYNNGAGRDYADLS